MTSLDRLTEATSRWMAKRSSRRSFLGNVGKAAVAVAGGSAIAGLFAEQAQARVCGQTGVSPKCPTYDCVQPGFWGYCWYASPGCCANGGLKKICDCCLTGWPNVQGYCPDGASVYCVVESCLEDPRVQTVTFDRFDADNPVTAARQRVAGRPGAPVVVIGSGAHPLAGALAAPVGAELNAPVLLIPHDQVPSEVASEIARLGAKQLVVAIPGLGPAALAALEALAPTQSLVVASKAEDWAGASVEVAAWLVQRGRVALVAIGADAEAFALAPSAAAFAASHRGAVMIGPDAVRAITRVYGEGRTLTTTCIGNAMKGTIPDAAEIVGPDPEFVSLLVADSTIGSDAGALTVGFTPVSAGGFGQVVSANSIVVVHNDGAFSERLRDWVIQRRRRFSRAETVTRAPGAFDAAAIYQVQSALNGFDAHQLSGYGGDGLPVYPQPTEERVIGKARVSGELPSTSRPPSSVRLSRPEDRFPVRTVVMPPPTSWPPGTTTTPLPPESAATTRPGTPSNRAFGLRPAKGKAKPTPPTNPAK